MKFILLAALFSTNIGLSQVSSIGHGTTILTAINNDSIIIAADSRHYIQNTRIPDKIDTVCKVECLNRIAFAIGGNADISYNKKEVFNAYKILRKAIRSNTSFDKIVSALDVNLNKRLRYAITIIDTSALLSAMQLPFLEIILTKFMDNKPTVLHIKYILTGNSIKDSKLEHLIMPNDKVPYLNKIGFYGKINSFLTRDKSYLVELSNIKPKLISLICLETNGNVMVAPPIDILTLKSNGRFYKARVDKCD